MFSVLRIFAKENGEEEDADEELGGEGWEEGEVPPLV